MKAWNLRTTKFSVGEGVEIDALILGEKGRGRRQTIVPAPAGIKDGDAVCLGKTRTGRIRINSCEDPSGGWLMRISTEGSYIRGAHGTVRVPKGAKNRVAPIAYGYGAFGAAGRVGKWDDILMTVSPQENEGILIRVKPSRGEPWFLVVTQETIKRFEDAEAFRVWLDTVAPTGLEIEVPEILESIGYHSENYTKFSDEWERILLV